MSLALVLSLLLTGFVIGGLARFAVPGPDPMPIWATIALGLAGAAIGGIVGKVLWGTPGGIVVALPFSILILIGYRHFVQHRPITGPRAHEPPR